MLVRPREEPEETEDGVKRAEKQYDWTTSPPTGVYPTPVFFRHFVRY